MCFEARVQCQGGADARRLTIRTCATQPEDPNVHKAREQDFRKGRQAPARAELSHAWCCHLVVLLSAPPIPFPAPHLLDPGRTYLCRGLYLLYFRSGVRDSVACGWEVPHLVSWRHGCGPRPGAHVARCSHASPHHFNCSVEFLICCGVDVSRACEFCFGSLRSTCRVRRQSGTTTPVEVGPA